MSVIDSYLPEDHDDEVVPQEPQELKDSLAANDKVAEANMNEVFDDFVKKQVTNKFCWLPPKQELFG